MNLRKNWNPEYKPDDLKPPVTAPDTISERATNVTLGMILDDQGHPKKTKIICTMGPKYWTEEKISDLIDAGMDVMRLNFSHGTHEAHGAVLERFKKVCLKKQCYVASLLDTKVI